MCLGGGDDKQKNSKPKGKQMGAGSGILNLLDATSASKAGKKSKETKDMTFGKGATAPQGPGAVYAWDNSQAAAPPAPADPWWVAESQAKGFSGEVPWWTDPAYLASIPVANQPAAQPGPTAPPATAPNQNGLVDAWTQAKRKQTTYGSTFLNPQLASGAGSGTVYG